MPRNSVYPKVKTVPRPLSQMSYPIFNLFALTNHYNKDASVALY